MTDLNYIEGTSLIMATATSSPYNVEIHDTNQATGSTYLSTNIKTGSFTATIIQGREIRNSGLHIIAAGGSDMRGWDRTNLSTAPDLWLYNAGGTKRALGSKSTTTWFLVGIDGAATFYKFHFETANTIQLTYASTNLYNHALTWFINTFYIIQIPKGGN